MMMIMMMATGSHENDNLCLSSVRFLVKHCTMHTTMYICTILVPMHYRYMNLLARVFAIESYDECVTKTQFRRCGSNAMFICLGKCWHENSNAWPTHNTHNDFQIYIRQKQHKYCLTFYGLEA